MSNDRLVRQVAQAWTGNKNPWKQYITKLCHKFDIDPVQAASQSTCAFKTLLKTKAAEYTIKLWQPTRVQGVLHRYQHAYGSATLQTAGKPSSFITALSCLRRGMAAELCLKLRTECLPLHAMHTQQRRQESAASRHEREKCRCCNASAETAHHFLSECSAFNTQRRTLHEALTQLAPAKMAALSAMQPDQQWRQLLNPAFWNSQTVGLTTVMTEAASANGIGEEFKYIATFVVDAWKARKVLEGSVLTGRVIDGSDPLM